MNPLIDRLLQAGVRLDLLELPEALSSWCVVDGVSVSPAYVAQTASSCGLSVDRPAPLRLIVSDGVSTLRLAFEPTVGELAHAAVTAALILDGTIPAPDAVLLDAELVDRLLDSGWTVPVDCSPLAEVATRLLLDRVGPQAARWELELAATSEPSVLELARRVDSIDR